MLRTQQEIAESVLLAIFPGEQRRIEMLTVAGTRNAEARNLYLKADFIREKYWEMQEALDLFRAAEPTLRLEPQHLPTLFHLGRAYVSNLQPFS